MLLKIVIVCSHLYIATVDYEAQSTFQHYITAGVWFDYNDVQRWRLHCIFTTISNGLATTYLYKDIIKLILC